MLKPCCIVLGSALVACTGSSVGREVGIDWTTVAAGPDIVVATSAAADGRCVATARRSSGAVWTTPLDGRCSLSHPAPFLGSDSVVVSTQNDEALRLRSIERGTGEVVWSVSLPAQISTRLGTFGKPAEMAADDSWVAVATDDHVWVLARDSGELRVDQTVSMVGPLRRVTVHAGAVSVVDTGSLHGWDLALEPVAPVPTGPAYSAALGDHWLWTDPDGTTHIKHSDGSAEVPSFPGRLRSGGWLLPDGSWVVATHIPDESPAILRVAPDGRVVWQTPIDVVAVDGANAAATGSGRVPFVVETGAGRHVLLVQVQDGQADVGPARPAHALIDASRFGYSDTAGLAVLTATLVVDSRVVHAVDSTSARTVMGLGGAVPVVWQHDGTTLTRLGLDAAPPSDTFGL